MAIVKGPALSIEASGNLGAICYAKWRNLQIARAVWTGTVPNTTKQVAQQGLLTTASQAWGGVLKVEERQTWHELAKSIVWRDRLGSPYVPSGYQLFMKWNIRRLVMGLSLMAKAPAWEEFPYVKFLSQEISATDPYIAMRLSIAVTVSHSGYGTEYYKAGPFDSGGRHPIEGEWLFMNRRVPPAAYVDLDVLNGKWYWYRGRSIGKFGGVGNWFEEQSYVPII